MKYTENHMLIPAILDEIAPEPHPGGTPETQAQLALAGIEIALKKSSRFIQRGYPMMAWAINRSLTWGRASSPRAINYLRCGAVQNAIATSFDLVSLVVPHSDTHDDLTFSIDASGGFGYYDSEIIVQFLHALGAVTVRYKCVDDPEHPVKTKRAVFSATFGRSALGDALDA